MVLKLLWLDEDIYKNYKAPEILLGTKLVQVRAKTKKNLFLLVFAERSLTCAAGES